MNFFINSMALFWALAEVWILLVLIQGVAAARGVPARPRLYGAIFILSAIGLAVIAFGGNAIAGQFAVMKNPRLFHLYRCAHWHFFCTFWVVLEGVIMVYIFRIYVMIRYSRNAHGRTHCSLGRLTLWARISVAILASCFFLFLIFYESQTAGLIQSANVTYGQVNRISLFYIKICGVFWIVFDGGVAVLGYKIYQLLNNQTVGSCGQHNGTITAVD